MVNITVAEPRDAKAAGRVLQLDGLRCLAVIIVIGFHYFSRWTPPLSDRDLYPYGAAFSEFALFQFGYYGVELFFVISGYVIVLTLFRCQSLLEFAVRRFARLWPAMVLCSAISFLVLRVLPNAPFGALAQSFLPSLMFTDPWLLERVTGWKGFTWMDGAYWSLYVEVRFYFLMAVLYFSSRPHFARNLLAFGAGVFALQASNFALHDHVVQVLTQELLIAGYLGWFLLGAAFHIFEREDQTRFALGLFLVGMLGIAIQAIQEKNVSMAVAGLIIPSVFFGAFRLVWLRATLSRPLFTAIGAGSYSLYLLHQYIGVSLIGALGSASGLRGPVAGVLAVATALILVLASQVVFRYWEAPLNRAIVSLARRSSVFFARPA